MPPVSEAEAENEIVGTTPVRNILEVKVEAEVPIKD